MSSPPQLTSPVFGRIPPPNGFLVVNNDSSPMATHGSGTLVSLIKNRSTTSLQAMARRRPSSLRGRDPQDVEEPSPIDRVGLGSGDLEDIEDFRHSFAEERRLSSILMGPQMRSQRLIGNSNPRYKWERYWKTDEELKAMKPAIREYYERTNSLVQQYLHIDRILDSTTPHNLINEYDNVSSSAHPSSSALRDAVGVPATIAEEPRTPSSDQDSNATPPNTVTITKVKRTPRGIYKVTDERSPLLQDSDVLEEEENGPKHEIPALEDDSVESGDRIVQIAIYVNLAANTILLLGKIGVMVLTSSLSVLASLVDAALDFLSTGIIWTTTRMIERQDQYQYPIGRRRLEPIGVLIFSVIMVTAFCQVGIECIGRLNSGDHSVIELTLPAIIIMCSTVLVKGLCWLWCRLIKNSSVQALAQDAMTDIIFNIFSIIFPLVGFYAGFWWMDALGGLLLSMFVIFNWAGTSAGHIRNLTGAAATADERNVLLYLTMRFAKTIKQIQGLKAYHSGDKLNVEVDIVLDENMSLRDSHDLGESLQYVLESVPIVDRAFVHQDYASYNLPTHMQQQGE